MPAPRLGAVLAAAALLVLFTAGPALAEPVRLTASGSGAEEVPPGEADATVRADMTVDTGSGSITYTVRVSGNDEPAAAAHIHRAPRGQAGDVVVPLDPAAVNEGRQATATADPNVAREIAENPENFYVNVHSPSFQQGFARGQLQAASPGSVPSGDGSSASDLPALVGAGLLLAGAGAVAVGVARRRGGGAAA
jgi:hypothetical protein